MSSVPWDWSCIYNLMVLKMITKKILLEPEISTQKVQIYAWKKEKRRRICYLQSNFKYVNQNFFYYENNYLYWKKDEDDKPWTCADKKASKTTVEIPTRLSNSLNDNDEVTMASKQNLEFSTLFVCICSSWFHRVEWKLLLVHLTTCFSW